MYVLKQQISHGLARGLLRDCLDSEKQEKRKNESACRGRHTLNVFGLALKSDVGDAGRRGVHVDTAAFALFSFLPAAVGEIQKTTSSAAFCFFLFYASRLLV